MLDESISSLVKKSGFFDQQWYLHRYKDVKSVGISPLEHFLLIGWLLGRDPSLKFSTEFYLKSHPDVAAANINPLVHYLQYGIIEGRAFAPVNISQHIDASLHNRKISSPARIAIYTAAIGGHDTLLDPECAPQHCDFYVFTDQKVTSKVWKQRPIHYFCDDKVKIARFIKLNPHLFFADYEYSIWLDTNIQPSKDLTHLLEGLDEFNPIAAFPHPYRSCVYNEAKACIDRGKDDAGIITTQVEKYRSNKFPESYGLWETGILARRHNELCCISLMTDWWKEVQLFSRRDQISLPVVLRNRGIQISSLAPQGADLRMYPGITFRPHQPTPNMSFLENQNSVAVLWRHMDTAIIPVDIVVCVHNALEEVRQCLGSVLLSMRSLDRLIIVDDASDTDTSYFLQEIAAARSNIELISNHTNMGYTKSANIGLRKSSAPYVILLNSDTILSKNVIDKMLQIAEQNSLIGILGPLSNAASWQSIPHLPDQNNYSENDLPKDFTLESVNLFLESIFTGVVPYVDLVNGFCYMIRREVIEKIGYLDEENFPVGYGEEDDYSLRARSSGFILAIATNSYVYHHKSKSFTSERRSGLAKSGKQVLDRKHTLALLSACVKSVSGHPEIIRIRDLLMHHMGMFPKRNIDS